VFIVSTLGQQGETYLIVSAAAANIAPAKQCGRAAAAAAAVLDWGVVIHVVWRLCRSKQNVSESELQHSTGASLCAACLRFVQWQMLCVSVILVSIAIMLLGFAVL
jgi:hypothetical protein